MQIETPRLLLRPFQLSDAAANFKMDSNPNVLMVDIISMVETMNTTGISHNGGTIYATYATGGGFSLDGIHPTAQGYALVANEIIKTINNGFNANIPTVNPGAYTTIFFE